MAGNTNTETIQTTISQLNRDFAGQYETNGYDETKLLHIHRDFVWNTEMQNNLLDSILKGYHIPPIICLSQMYEGMERREIIDGGNRINTIRRILNNELRELTSDERQQIEAFGIELVVTRNLRSNHQGIIRHISEYAEIDLEDEEETASIE